MRAVLCILAVAAALMAMQAGIRCEQQPEGAGPSRRAPAESLAAQPLAAGIVDAAPNPPSPAADGHRPSQIPHRLPVLRSCRNPAHLGHVAVATERVQLPTTPSPAARCRSTRWVLRAGGADDDAPDTVSLPG